MKKLLTVLAVGVVTLGMAETASASMVAHWGFDETGGTTAFDSVGEVNGTLVGGAAFTTTGGITGGAIEITDGFANMGNNLPSTSTFSLQAWVKTASGDTSLMTPVSKHWSTIGQGYYLSINNVADGYTSANLPGFRSIGGSPSPTATGLPAVNDGLWHQLVGVYNNGVSNLYVDGNFVASTFAGFSNNTADFLIGGLFVGGAPTNAFKGLIDEVLVYDSALTAAEVGRLYANVTAVPEPESYAMMMAGLGLISLIALRRKHS